MEDKDYVAPQISDYGDIQELTASVGAPTVVDVPKGTPVVPGSPIVGVS